LSDSYEQLAGDNVVKTTLRHINRQLLKPGKIYDFQYSCTWKCQARCNHCFIWKKKPTYELTVEELDKVLRPRSLFYDCRNLILTGGDPFERKDLKELLLFFSELLPHASISTPTNDFGVKELLPSPDGVKSTLSIILHLLVSMVLLLLIILRVAEFFLTKSTKSKTP